MSLWKIVRAWLARPRVWIPFTCAALAAMALVMCVIGSSTASSATSAISVPRSYTGTTYSQEHYGSLAISATGKGTVNYRIFDPIDCPLPITSGNGDVQQCYVYLTFDVLKASTTKLIAHVIASHATLVVQPKLRGFLNGRRITITVVSSGVLRVDLSNIKYRDPGASAIKFCRPPLQDGSPC